MIKRYLISGLFALRLGKHVNANDEIPSAKFLN